MNKIYFYLFLFFLTFTTFSQPDWELAKIKNGIKVYSKFNSKTGIKELKSETVFKKTKLSTIFAIFKDVENCGKWTKDLKKSYIIKEISETEGYEYYQISVPWPIQNRDVVYLIKYTFDENEKSLIINATSSPNYIPKVSNVVRISDSVGKWKFTKLNDGNLKVENFLFADPVGFPAWLVNLLSVESPIKVITALNEFSKSPKYQNRFYSFIKE